MTASPSGEQFTLRHGEQDVTVVEVGGGVRAFQDGDRRVLEPYAEDAICDGARGQVLAPWPNRLADGQYSFDGVAHQVALTEPASHNAIHGLVRWQPWRAEALEENRVSLTCTLFPTPGYPFMLGMRVDYRLDDAGLTVVTTATNHGRGALPYGSGQHPYLSTGGGLVDDCTVRLPAEMRIVTDPERQLPTGLAPVAGTPFDFREARRLGELRVDHAFTDLARDPSGVARVHLTGPDGRTVEFWAGSGYPLIQLYTADTLAPTRRRRSLACEPMTCPPNALATGDGVIRLQPGESTSATWGVRLLP